VVLPSGTQIQVRVNDSLSSATAQEGDRFTGVLAAPVIVDGKTIFPEGSNVSGRVIEAAPSGRLSSSGVLKLTLNSIQSGPRVANISTEPYLIQGESHTKSNTQKIGGGAALGAIIGAIAGGGKGAAIGATVGAGAGAGAAAATGKKEASVEAEAELEFITSHDANVATLSPEQQEQRRAEETPRLQTRSGEPVPVENAQVTPAPAAAPAPAPGASANPEPTPPAASSNGRNLYVFNLRDRRVINQCLAENRDQTPAAPATTSSVQPPIKGRQHVDILARNTQLSASLQKKVRPLPYACERQLPPLPQDLERVVYGDSVMLLNSSGRIVDIFQLEK
jgi:outer membrane lipoprotein SlyB